ncbi:MAG: hypothetical protein ACI4F7_07230 [Acutalibacteraceae bacterium]
MNYINCKDMCLPEELRNAVAFWAKNTVGHLETLLKLGGSSTAVMQPCFSSELNDLLSSFRKISELYSSKQARLPAKPQLLFSENRRLINLLERMKFEGFGGYPYLQQTIFHYIYEQRYINAIFGVQNENRGLITVRFSPIGGYPLVCIYNQMYFWSVIGAMHPSLMMGNERFYRSASLHTREYLTEITNRFNVICFELSSLRKPPVKAELKRVFDSFCGLNLDFLRFLRLIKANGGGIFAAGAPTDMPQSFYKSLDHIISEHTLVKELNEGMERSLL